ncbi:MAG: response regulator [Pseudomonadota bacterium]
MATNLEIPRILVVDDEESIRIGAERILNRMGCKVFKASEGEACLELLKENRVSVVLLDLKMPGLDGMEVLSQIRAFDESILVIIITGFATIDTAIQAMKHGAYDFIPKPFEPDQLRLVVDRALEKVRLTKEAEKLQEERKKTLSDLHTEKSRTHTIIESLPNGVVVTNAQGQVVLMNPAFLSYLDLDPNLAPGRPIEEYVSDKGFCKLIMDISEGKLLDPNEVPTYEFSPAKDRYFIARGRPFLSDDNECLGAVVNISDVTAIKILDNLKSDYVIKVSHELRAPLSTIHEQLAFVLKGLVEEVPEKDIHILSRAKEKTQGLISLIGDLLDLSRIEAGNVLQQTRSICIESLLKNIVEFLDTRAKAKNQALILETPGEKLPAIEADPQALESIFGNLIINAINYTEENGEIRVKADLNKDAIRVQVADTGFGIEERFLDKIFVRFFRVKNEKTRLITGTGLGLPIVKGLLDEMGGTIQVQSTQGKGSTFTVNIPVKCLK